MNKKIKIIELLNKMNNQEELPRKIQYGYDNNNCPAIWRFVVCSRDYCCSERDTMDNYLFRDYIGDITVVLDNEVEILEDNTEEIEELPKMNFFELVTDEVKTAMAMEKIKLKVDELVKAVNEIRKDKSNER